MIRPNHRLDHAQQFQIHNLTEIYEDFSPQLYYYALSRLGIPAYAEDCVADTFQRFLQSLQKKTSIENTRAYLYRIAHNWITDHYRKKSEDTDQLPENIAPRNQKSLEGSAVEELEHENLRLAIRELPPIQQQVIVLRYLEDWSQKEVAATIERSVGAVKQLQRRAEKKLKKMLESDRGER